MMFLPVIMAGGTGSRLWPLSRELYPKQFLSLYGDETMLQATIHRLNGLPSKAPLIVCNQEHRFIVAEQLRQIGQSHGGIILEPVGKNTAPALALAAMHALSQQQDPVLLVLAADHVIQNTQAFQQTILDALPYANEGHLVAFGIKPLSPETGYGYIKTSDSQNTAMPIEAFVEKPNQKTANMYFESGQYYWNSGLFLFKASQYLNELKQYRPEIYDHCASALNQATVQTDFIAVDKKIFEQCPADSIDYAVMEKTDQAVMVPLSAGWNDLGSWSALWEIGEKDERGNVHKGDVIDIDSQNCYVNAKNKLVATVGLDNLVVVDTQDALLIADKSCVQHVKKVVEYLNKNFRKEAHLHREVCRPWGKFDSIDQGPRYQVKHITVNPGEKLSLQMHHHRAEHWVVVSGTARVTQGDKVFLLTEDQSTYIPVGVVHALENPGKVPLEIIEIQSGAYLGEDDIVRFEDRYGRLSATEKKSEELSMA